MGTDASRLDRLELGCNCLGAKGNERFGEGVLMRKKKGTSVQVGGCFSFAQNGRATGGRLGAGKRGGVCFRIAPMCDNQWLYPVLQLTECFHPH